MYFPLAQRALAWLSRPGRRRIQRADEDALKLLPKGAHLHPAHAAYVAAQHQIAAMAEELADCPELAPLTNLIADAEDEYMPAGPPISPLTHSYFTCWSLFDVCVGRPGRPSAASCWSWVARWASIPGWRES